MITRKRRPRRHRADFYTTSSIPEESREQLIQAINTSVPSGEAARLAGWLVAVVRRQPADLRSITRALDALTRAAAALQPHSKRQELAQHFTNLLNDVGDQLLYPPPTEPQPLAPPPEDPPPDH
jgi:hypothetical protein